MKLFKTLGLTLCLVTPAMAQSSFPLTEPFLYKHITSNTTTVVKTGPGVLHTICVSTKGASSNTLKAEDAVTDTTPVIAIIDTTALTGCTVYDIAFTVGLTIVTTTGTAPDATISYK